jgi:hypothetical protein
MATEAQILANRSNSKLAKGPTSPQGRERSRSNSLKHGLTGAGIVLPEEDAAEVERLTVALRDEFKPAGAAGEILVRQMATMAVRMDRCADQETAALSQRVRTVMDEFVPPEGVDAEEAERLRVEAGKIALFDPSKEACLARKYEAAAQRGFFRALKELTQPGKKESGKSPAEEAAAQAKASMKQLGSFLPGAEKAAAKHSTAPPKAIPAPSKPVPAPSKPLSTPSPTRDPFAPSHFDVPFSIGRAR